MVRVILTYALGIVLAGSASAQLLDKKTVSLAAAKKMAAACEAQAAKNNWKVVITILDDGGNLVYLERMDGATLAQIQLSEGKARAALFFKTPSKTLQDELVNGVVAPLSVNGVVRLQGGLPIMVEGKLIGAIGTSGASQSQDDQCSQAGINTLSVQ